MPVPLIAAGIAGVAGIGAAAMGARSAEKAQEAATQQAEAQRTAAQEAQERAIAATRRTPEEQAFTSMMMQRAEAGLGAPEFESTTAQETEKGLEALQKFYMQRGFQPSPRETGLLIEPSQRIARDVAIQNALLKRQAQQQAWNRAYQMTPIQQRLIEQQAGGQAALAGMPYEVAAAGVPGQFAQTSALAQMQQASQTQQALGGMLAAYTSPLFQQRITGGGSNIVGGQGGTYTGYQRPPGLPGGQTWSPYR